MKCGMIFSSLFWWWWGGEGGFEISLFIDCISAFLASLFFLDLDLISILILIRLFYSFSSPSYNL